MSENESKSSIEGPRPLLPVKFHCEKAPDFRTLHADGVWGIPGGENSIYLLFYADRPPFPDIITQSVDPQTGAFLAELPKVDTKHDLKFWNVMRTFQGEVCLSVSSAVQLRDVLSNYIKQVETASK